MPPRLVIRLLALLLPALAVAPARAAWPPEGLLVGALEQGQESMRMFFEPNGGMRLLWAFRAGVEGSQRCFKLQSLKSDGTIAPGWPDSAITLECASGMQGLLRADGKLFFSHDDVYVARLELLLTSGERDPAWPAGGLAIDTVTGNVALAALASDDAGGVFYVWNASTSRLRLVRIGGDASVHPGWPASGILVTAANIAPGYRTLRDGHGGVIVMWFGNRVYAKRYDGDGFEDPGWPSGGLRLNAATPDPSTLGLSELFPSGTDYFIALWDEMSGDGLYHVRAQRFGVGGARDPAWPAEGRLIATTDARPSNLAGVPDGSGGVIVAWNGGLGPRTVRVLTNNTLSPGWPAAGIPLLAPDVPTSTIAKLVAGAGGGAIGLWAAPAVDDLIEIRGRWISPAGVVDPGEPTGGFPLVEPTPQLQLLGASRDAAGGVLVGWSREAPADSEMFEPLLTRVANVSNVGVPTLATLPALALSAPAPNPARTEALIRCTLPRAEVARLELVDLAGRRVHSRTFSGAGIHTERLTGLDRLAPGLYFLTLVQGGASSVRRIAIVH